MENNYDSFLYTNYSRSNNDGCYDYWNMPFLPGNNIYNNFGNATLLNTIKATYTPVNINEKFNNSVLICIFNYKQDENAKKWLYTLRPYFEVYVLDVDNDHDEKDFKQYPNIYYSGLFNEMKKLASNKDYKWVGQICSDIEIDKVNIKKLIYSINNLLYIDNIGIWQPGTDKTSRKSWTYNEIMNADNNLLKVSFIEGWMHFIRKDILDNIPYVDTNINLYGYGIDIFESYMSNKMNYLNVIDTNIRVHNPVGTGYNMRDACIQGDNYLINMLGQPLSYYIKLYQINLLDKKITFVVPFRDRNDMKCAFEKNVQRYFSNTGYEIIYVIQEDLKPFMISLLRNIGFMHAKTEYVVFRDIDILDLERINLTKNYNLLNGPYRAYNKRLHVTLKDNDIDMYKDKEHTVSGYGGYTVFKKDDWEKNNGFTNLCIGWGYEDDMARCRYNLKTYDRTFGHIWHKLNESFGTDDTNINKDAYFMERDGKIDAQLDGYKLLTCDIISDKQLTSNIREIKVCNIGVTADYAYKDILLKHKDARISCKH